MLARVECFGHGSLSCQLLDDNNVLVNEIEERTGLHCIPGMIVHSFFKEKPKATFSLEEIARLPVGQSQQAIKSLYHEQKKAAKSNR